MEKKFNLKNYMEDVVFSFLDELIKGKQVCTCERCRYDIAAIALNHLPAKYVVTEQGEVFAKTQLLSQQFKTDAVVELLKAIDIVCKNPHH
ncbi:late competence development ComFB family protein [Thermosediminibacter litoriperuensis]|uniref:Competence protein ComFB n=1 Tax=Thermosediminibacter litoriperuensis TaxID=291989 RepID=A0A5S5AMX1_9FIRM|nr:late competence development ComFB family protein [Thermosediminibacter litoriperuensis]TYP51619.1 competence protein ComFB [Thermosediminibacter litoriperuensis]